MSERLDKLIESYSRLGDKKARRLMVVLLLPFCVAVLVEWVLLATTTEKMGRFPLPVEEPWIYPRTFESESGWGDLYRLWSPRSERLFPDTDRTVVRVVDSEGFRSSEHDDEDVDVVLYGASFFERGSSNEQTFSGRLESLSGLKVRTRAWPGRTAEFGILRNRLTEAQVREKKPIVLWSCAARILRHEGGGGGLTTVARQVDGAGQFLGAPVRSFRDKIREALNWHNRLEIYLRARSPLARFATQLRRWLPPMSLDPVRGDVRIASLRPPFEPEPMLFFQGSIHTAHTESNARDDAVLEGIRRVKAYYDNLGVQLVMVLVPDKYQMFHEYLEPGLGPPDSEFVPISAYWAEKLRGIDMPVIDLDPDIRAAQMADPQTLLYRPDDTHWNDLGIRVGAEATLRHLREMGLIPPR